MQENKLPSEAKTKSRILKIRVPYDFNHMWNLMNKLN